MSRQITVKYKCDICGKTYSYEEVRFKYSYKIAYSNMLFFPKVQGETFAAEFDLCNECWHKLWNFLRQNNFQDKERKCGKDDWERANNS